MRSRLMVTAVAILATGLSAPALAQPKDIVDTAVAAGTFKTLAKLLTDADLVGVMKGPGPFTVFAPTDDAFAKVPKDVLDGLAKDKAKLQDVLKYHVRLLERHDPRDRRRPAAAAVAAHGVRS